MKQKCDYIKICAYLILTIGAISMVLPFIWLLVISLNDTHFMSFGISTLKNTSFSVENFKKVFDLIKIEQYFLNSLIVATFTTVGQVLFASMSGYAFARLRFNGKNAIFFLILITMMVPIQVNIVPLFFIMREFGWCNTYAALIIPGFFGGFGIFLMRQWFLGLPKELEDAAKIDGCNLVETFFKIVLPSSIPAIMTLAIFTFIGSWNSFMWPLIITNTQNMRTLSVGLNEFKSSFVELTDWGALCACCVISCLPAILVFLAGKKYLLNNLLSGSSK